MKSIKAAMRQELKELENAREVLAYSYKKCARIGVRPGLSNEELESFEALTGRFARLTLVCPSNLWKRA